jgi:hypothetical protein
MFKGTYRIAVIALLFGMLLIIAGCQSKPSSEVETLARVILSNHADMRMLAHDKLAEGFGSVNNQLVRGADVKPVWEALKGDDELKLVDEMLKAKVSLIALPLEMGEKLASDGSLFEDFANSGNYQLFSQLYIDGDMVLVALTDAAYRINDEEMALVIAYTRAGLAGTPSGTLPGAFAQKSSQEAVVEMRLTGPDGYNRKFGTVRGRGDNPKAALDVAIGIGRKQMAKGQIDAAYLDTAVITLNFYRERGKFLQRGGDMFKQIALGIDGLIITTAGKDAKTVTITPDKSMIYRVENVGKLLEKAMLNAKLDKKAWEADGAAIEKFRTMDLTELAPKGKVVRLFRGVPYVDPEKLDVPTIHTAFKSGADWLLANFDANTKMFKYEYYAARDQWRNNRYNIIRHGLATLTLIQAYELYKDERFLDAAELAIEWVMELSEWEGDMAYFAHKRFDPQYKLGGAGVMLQAMCEFVRSRPMPAWDKMMRGYGNFIVRLQEENGHYKSFYTKPGQKEIDREVTIYPGEASLALVRLYKLTGDKKYLDTVDKAFQYYSKWFNRKKNPRSKGDLGAFVPWDMSAMAEFWEVVKRDDVAEYGYQMADWVLDNWYVWGPKQTYWKDLVGGFHGARRKTDIPLWNSGVYGEGIASIYRMATLRGDKDRIEKYRRSAFLTIRFVRNLQYRPGSVYHLQGPENAIGAIPSQYSMDDCRLDYAYHCLTVNYRALRFFSDEDWKALGVTPPAPKQEIPADTKPEPTGE